MSAAASGAISAVVLTMGDRPDDLARAVSSVRGLARAGLPAEAASAAAASMIEVVVVWNGVAVPADSPADVDVVLDANVGIPEGRNLGAERCSHDVIVFLDDDAYLELGQQLADLVAPFDDPATGVVAVRISDDRGRTASRHVPRLGGRRALKGGEVTAFLGGACVMRTDVFRDVGGYAGDFFYAMEETDLALRIVDTGYRIMYEPDVIVRHPWVEPTRHADALSRTARNRVWLAHRNLPAVLAVAYVAIWLAISVGRNVTSPSAIGSIVRGTRDGIRRPLGPRRPIRWSTAWRLTRLGRPPIV